MVQFSMTRCLLVPDTNIPSPFGGLLTVTPEMM